MRVKLALLADSANVSREGKLNLLGIFDAIFARELPTSHPHMHLVLRFEALPADAGSTVAIGTDRAGCVEKKRRAGHTILSPPAAPGRR